MDSIRVERPLLWHLALHERHMMKAVLALLLCVVALPALAGWVAESRPRHLVSPGMVLIQYLPEEELGVNTFEEAFDDVAKSGAVGRVELITMHSLVRDETFQAELRHALEASAPAQLAAALGSSGNMDN